jgi:hypothetical protein
MKIKLLLLLMTTISINGFQPKRVTFAKKIDAQQSSLTEKNILIRNLFSDLAKNFTPVTVDPRIQASRAAITQMVNALYALENKLRIHFNAQELFTNCYSPIMDKDTFTVLPALLTDDTIKIQMVDLFNRIAMLWNLYHLIVSAGLMHTIELPYFKIKSTIDAWIQETRHIQNVIWKSTNQVQSAEKKEQIAEWDIETEQANQPAPTPAQNSWLSMLKNYLERFF